MTTISNVAMAFGHSPQKVEKPTQGKPYGIESLAIRDDLPISEIRQLSESEENALREGQDAWYPKIFAGYNTKPVELLASPEKVGLLQGLGLGSVASAVTGGLLSVGGFSGLDSFLTTGAGLLAGALGFVGGYFSQRKSNENTIDMMKRLPEGATLRDMLADPLYRQEREPITQVSNGGWGSTLNTGILAAALMNRPNRN